MSVIRFASQEMESLRDQVKLSKDCRSAVAHTDIWRAQYFTHSKFGRMTGSGQPDEEQLTDEIIDRAFWYFQVANRVAHSLQYQEEPGLFEKEERSASFEECSRSPKRLYDSLCHLQYNLLTNDGNVFLENKWTEVLDRCIQWLASQLLFDRKAG